MWFPMPVAVVVRDALDTKMPDIYDQLFAPGPDWVARQP